MRSELLPDTASDKTARITQKVSPTNGMSKPYPLLKDQKFWGFFLFYFVTTNGAKLADQKLPP